MDNDDITVIIKGQKFKTTRKILTDNSEYFENLFKEFKDIKNEIALDDRNPRVFENILKYFEDIEYDINRYCGNDFCLQEMKFYLIKYDRLDKYGELSKIKVDEIREVIIEKELHIRELRQKINDIEDECKKHKNKIRDIDNIIKTNLRLKIQENTYVYNITRIDSPSYIRMSFTNLSDATNYLEMHQNVNLQIIIMKSEKLQYKDIVNSYFYSND